MVLALDKTGIIVIVTIGAVLLLAAFVLLYFLVLQPIKYRKQIRNLEKQYSYYDSLLIGQDTQYIHRLEIISRTNLLYMSKYETFNRRFRNIYDTEDKYADSILKQLNALIKAKQYKNIKSVISEAKKAIDTLGESTKALDHDLHEVIKLEEDCRRSIDHLREVYRHVKQTYYSESDDLELVSQTFNKMFDKIDGVFSKFEDMLEGAEYEEINQEISSLDSVLTALGHVLIDLPYLCATLKTTIPEKLNQLQAKYRETEKEGVPLYHLSFKSRSDEWKKRNQELTKKIINLQCSGLKAESNIILEEMNELSKLLDQEVEARDYFNANFDRIYRQVNDVEKRFLKICSLLPEIQQIYQINEAEKKRIDELSTSIDNLSSAKRFLDGFVHSGTRQPFSLLKGKLDELEENYNVVNAGVNAFKDYVDSLKSTAEEAYKLISSYYHRTKLSEAILAEIDNANISSRYNEKIDLIYESLNDIYTEIQSRPIKVEDVSVKINNLESLANSMFDEIEVLYKEQKNAEVALTILNSERDEQDINQVATGLELAFDKGDFASVSSQAISIYKNRHTANE